jgi:hypothetical protein
MISLRTADGTEHGSHTMTRRADGTSFDACRQ